jgi:hypothetical protein
VLEYRRYTDEAAGKRTVRENEGLHDAQCEEALKFTSEKQSAIFSALAINEREIIPVRTACLTK